MKSLLRVYGPMSSLLCVPGLLLSALSVGLLSVAGALWGISMGNPLLLGLAIFAIACPATKILAVLLLRQRPSACMWQGGRTLHRR